jgi:glycosyltransferase involved in cell wall biosynthesis
MTGVLIDVTRLMRRFKSRRLPTGVDRVSLAYIRHYGAQARAVLMYGGAKFVFRRSESEIIFNWLLSLGKSGSLLPTLCKGLVAGCRAQQVAGSILFNTGHSGLESGAYASRLHQLRVKPVFVLHDLIPISHPQFCRIGEQAKHLARMRNAVQAASAIVCNSQATLDALDQLCQEHAWLRPPAVVALLAPDLPAPTHAPRPMKQAYFVFVSTIEPRKNHMMILRVWEQLAVQLGASTPKLIIIGQRGWDYSPVTDLLERSAVLKTLVTELPACSDAQMVNYLEHAQALLFPSFTEGYGMPVVEALALGVPVIASDLPVFHEFAGTIPEYLAVNDHARWVAAIADYAAPDNPKRNAQLARIKDFVAPAWKRHFASVDALIADLEDEA